MRPLLNPVRCDRCGYRFERGEPFTALADPDSRRGQCWCGDCFFDADADWLQRSRAIAEPARCHKPDRPWDRKPNS